MKPQRTACARLTGEPRAKALAVATTLLVSAGSALAADYDESLLGDLSGNRLAPSFWALTDGPVGSNGLTGNNVLSGRTGRSLGVVDIDYVNVSVPQGFELSALLVGNSTTSSGALGSFIGLAAGNTMPVSANALSAVGLLGWRHYTQADRMRNILPDMGSAGQGATGFTGPLPAGDYTLWIQELATGSYNYRFNLQISPVPEPGAAALLVAGLVLLGGMARRSRR